MTAVRSGDTEPIEHRREASSPPSRPHLRGWWLIGALVAWTWGWHTHHDAIRFLEEEIRITLLGPDRVALTATYIYKNQLPVTIERSLRYPFPDAPDSDTAHYAPGATPPLPAPTLPGDATPRRQDAHPTPADAPAIFSPRPPPAGWARPEHLEVTDNGRRILPITGGDGSLHLPLSFGPGEIKTVTVRFSQPAPTQTFRYLVTTTRTWGRPLQRAVFIVDPADTGQRWAACSLIPDLAGRTDLASRCFTDFWPATEFDLAWRDAGKDGSVPVQPCPPSRW